uniref:Uncharacterized protein n=1 Tax=Romanomermis culicivorax TaxID=13658 RepID=A0A915I2F0_ROMCU
MTLFTIFIPFTIFLLRNIAQCRRLSGTVALDALYYGNRDNTPPVATIGGSTFNDRWMMNTLQKDMYVLLSKLHKGLEKNFIDKLKNVKSRMETLGPRNFTNPWVPNPAIFVEPSSGWLHLPQHWPM